MSREEIAERHQTFMERAFYLQQFRALVADRVSTQLVELMPTPFKVIAERIISQITQNTQEYATKMAEKSERARSLLGQLRKIVQTRQGQKKQEKREDVKLNKKIYLLLDEFDEAVTSLPDLKDVDLEVSADLVRVGNQISEESGFKLKIGGQLVGQKRQSNKLIEQAQEAKERIKKLSEEKKEIEGELKTEREARRKAQSALREIRKQNKILQARLKELEMKAQLRDVMSKSQKREEKQLNKRELTQKDKKQLYPAKIRQKREEGEMSRGRWVVVNSDIEYQVHSPKRDFNDGSSDSLFDD